MVTKEALKKKFDEIVKLHNLYLCRITNGRVSFNKGGNRFIFFWSKVYKEWGCINTGWPSRKASEIFQEIGKAGIITENGKTNIEVIL